MRVVDTVAYRVQSLQDETDEVHTAHVAADADAAVTLPDPESLQGMQPPPSQPANVKRIRVIPYLIHLFFTNTNISAQ